MYVNLKKNQKKKEKPDENSLKFIIKKKKKCNFCQIRQREQDSNLGQTKLTKIYCKHAHEKIIT